MQVGFKSCVYIVAFHESFHVYLAMELFNKKCFNAALCTQKQSFSKCSCVFICGERIVDVNCIPSAYLHKYTYVCLNVNHVLKIHDMHNCKK
jgi:hypothetical protein